MLVKEDFKSHAGLNLTWKIEADDLTEDDWKAAAYIISRKFSFYAVQGIPRGGLKLSRPLIKYSDISHGKNLLIVDDVLTTGGSMETAKSAIRESGVLEPDIVGVVLFARGPCPSWIIPVFRLNEMFYD